MSGFEWFLLVVVVIAVPLVVAVMVTLWTLEQARLRNRKNREAADGIASPAKRKATREGEGSADRSSPVVDVCGDGLEGGNDGNGRAGK